MVWYFYAFIMKFNTLIIKLFRLEAIACFEPRAMKIVAVENS